MAVALSLPKSVIKRKLVLEVVFLKATPTCRFWETTSAAEMLLFM